MKSEGNAEDEVILTCIIKKKKMCTCEMSPQFKKLKIVISSFRNQIELLDTNMTICEMH